MKLVRGSLCDSRVGLTQGACQPIDPLCQNATPGQAVCATATSVAQCGPDLVSETAPQSCTGTTPACLNGGCVACKPTSTEACGVVCGDGTATCDSAGAWGPCTGESSKHTYYLDADHDGYGDPKTSTTACSAPTGYVSNSGDCCDSDANVHPGQTASFTTADKCGGFDYDCDGTVTQEFTTVATTCSVAIPACAAGWTTAVPGCGIMANWNDCAIQDFVTPAGISRGCGAAGLALSQTQACR